MIRRCLTLFRPLAVLLLLACSMVVFGTTYATAATVDNPQNGALGIEGKVPGNPPKTGATISSPSNGQGFTTLPVTVSGLCPTGLLVKIFSNNVFVGSVFCEKGSYSVQIDLFSGRNDLVARVTDSLDQSGPDSNIVTVNFNDKQFNPFGGPGLSITSNYAERGANPGDKLTWPIVLNGGTGPYAISVDWGDGKTSDLISTQFTGTIDLSHVYDKSGIYRITIRATDKNGLAAFLQLVGVANGAVVAKANTSSDEGKTIITRVLWAPAALSLPLLFVTFWLGRRYELAALRKHLEQRD